MGKGIRSGRSNAEKGHPRLDGAVESAVRARLSKAPVSGGVELFE